ncbi:MAG: alpha/beta hydrolase [Pseudomonadota bacterium]
MYIAPKNKEIKAPPANWLVRDIHLNQGRISGWFVEAPNNSTHRCVLMMHGLNGNRNRMINIANFLYDANYSLLLFDFRGHGASKPDMVTLGLRESDDARVAFNWLKEQGKCRKIGVWGHSMGGAAAVLGASPLEADALVLDSTYATIEQATYHRIKWLAGDTASKLLSPLLLAQIPFRLHAKLSDLHPVEAIKNIHSPVLIIYGTADQSAYPEEAHALFNAAGSKQKEIFEVKDAGHGRVYFKDPVGYERKVKRFFDQYLH